MKRARSETMKGMNTWWCQTTSSLPSFFFQSTTLNYKELKNVRNWRTDKNTLYYSMANETQMSRKAQNWVNRDILSSFPKFFRNTWKDIWKKGQWPINEQCDWHGFVCLPILPHWYRPHLSARMYHTILFIASALSICLWCTHMVP